MNERVKNHFKEHRELYFGIGIGLGLATVTCLIMKNYSDRCLAVVPKELPRSTMEETSSSFFANNVRDSFNTTVNYGGYSHKIVRNNNSGELFGTVTAAAESAGVPFSKMSRHLNGHMEHINNETFSIIGIGTL